MNCISCGVEVSPAFKHAFSQNICPACGESLIDEESLALIEDLGATLSSEATLRAETAHKLAVALVARYEIQMRGNTPIVRAPRAQPAATPPMRVAKSATQQLIKESAAPEPNIMTAEQLQQAGESGEISNNERDAIMADVVSKRYGMVDQITAEGIKGFEGEELPSDILEGSLFSEGAKVPILEQERLLRLQKQQQALMTGGKNSFRRSE